MKRGSEMTAEKATAQEATRKVAFAKVLAIQIIAYVVLVALALVPGMMYGDAAKPAAVLVASGSEVSTLVEGATLLAEEGIPVRIVSALSEGLFRDQPKSYQESVLPAGLPRYGLTSGLPVTLRGLVGEKGMIHGLDHFGYSAPYKVLDEKFGYNGVTVAAEVKQLLGK